MKTIGNSRRRVGPYWKQPIDLTDRSNSAPEPDAEWSKEEEFEIAQWPLDRDFPELFSEVKRILQIYDQSIDDGTIKLTIGVIVYTLRKRRSNPGYYDTLRKCAIDADNAAHAVEQLRHLLLSSLDFQHINMLNGMVEDQVPIMRIPAFETLPRQQIIFFEAIGHWLSAVSLSLHFLCLYNAEPEKRGKGRPSSPYWFEVFELVHCWFGLTGRFPEWPKLLRGIPAQHSTLFFFSCMKMIHPDITASEVKTAAEQAVKAHKDMLGLLVDHPGMTFEGYVRLLLQEHYEANSRT